MPPRFHVFLHKLPAVCKLITAVLLILWGGLSFLVLPITEEGVFIHPFNLDTIRSIGTFFHAIGCLIAGITCLSRWYRATRILLTGTALSVVVIAGVNIPIWLKIRPDLKQAVFEWTIQYLIGSLVLFFLGWWLGRQEDSEA